MASATRTIVAAGTICGVLDAVSAVAVSLPNGTPPLRVFQGIAVGILGPSALKGGTSTAALGLALHFLIAFGAAATYYAASRWIPVLIKRALLCGVLYGIVVHLFMRFVVTPLSAIGWHRPALRPFLTILAVHIVVVGPSIALTIRRYAPLNQRFQPARFSA
jgi:hypothetical protein